MKPEHLLKKPPLKIESSAVVRAEHLNWVHLYLGQPLVIIYCSAVLKSEAIAAKSF